MEREEVKIIGMLWFRNSAEHDSFLQVFIDSHLLPRSYSSWRRQAEQMHMELLRMGKRVVKVHATTEEFRAYIDANGMRPDKAGRTAFAAWKALQECTGIDAAEKDGVVAKFDSADDRKR